MTNSKPNNFDASQPQTVTFNGAQVPVEIEPEANGELSTPQREALRLLQNLPSDVLELAAPAVVQNYEVYREAIGDDELPPLEAPVDVWKRVEPTSFFIPPHDETTTPTFFLQAECDWDPEHGLEVRFRNGQADASDQQGEMGLED
jgi:hypothetical protein